MSTQYGKRFSTLHDGYKIENFSIGDFYMMELSEVLEVLETLKRKSLYNNIVCKNSWTYIEFD